MQNWKVQFNTTFKQSATFVSSSEDVDDAKKSFQDYLLNQMQYGPEVFGVEIVSFEKTAPETNEGNTLN